MRNPEKRAIILVNRSRIEIYIAQVADHTNSLIRAVRGCSVYPNLMARALTSKNDHATHGFTAVVGECQLARTGGDQLPGSPKLKPLDPKQQQYWMLEKYQKLLGKAQTNDKGCHIWRKSKIAARIIARSQNKSFQPPPMRDVVLGGLLGEDPEVTDRLISQALNKFRPRVIENAAPQH